MRYLYSLQSCYGVDHSTVNRHSRLNPVHVKLPRFGQLYKNATCHPIKLVNDHAANRICALDAQSRPTAAKTQPAKADFVRLARGL